MSDERKYSDAEVRAILERALKGEAGGESGIGHAELQAIGEQVGVSSEAMSRAAAEVLESRSQSEALGAIKARRRRWLGLHAGIFALINGLLFAVNFLTTPGEWWVLFSVFFWGLGLALHAGVALGLGASPAALERERRRLQGPLSAKSRRLRVGPTIDAQAVLEADVAEPEPAREKHRS
jgi:hypothetical protein